MKGGKGGGGGGGPAPFLVKTHEMVEMEETNEVISWGEKGISFVVWKPVEFARDLLPANFKHNNFSSFVRQLNTYGFRKVVPDRWEFANEYFKRGEPSLLSEIRRRKALQPSLPSALKSSGGTPHSSSTNSGEVHSSSSTSSPPHPQPAELQLLQLSNENEKLKRDNHLLLAELAQAKKHCEELVGFLSKYVDISQLNIGPLAQDALNKEHVEVEEDIDNGDKESKDECLKLFGVMLTKCKGENDNKRKRSTCVERDGGRPAKEVPFAVPWMGITPPSQDAGKVCN